MNHYFLVIIVVLSSCNPVEDGGRPLAVANPVAKTLASDRPKTPDPVKLELASPLSAPETAVSPTASTDFGDPAENELRLEKKFNGLFNFQLSSGAEVLVVGPFPYSEDLPCKSPQHVYQPGSPTYRDFRQKQLSKAFYCVKVIAGDDAGTISYHKITFFTAGRAPNRSDTESPAGAERSDNSARSALALQQTPNAENSDDKLTNESSSPTEKSSECQELASQTGTSFQYSDPNLADGSEVAVQCQDGYIVLGSPRATCQNGRWNNLPSCIPCTGSSRWIQNGRIELDSDGYFLTCNPGFTREGPSRTRCDEEDSDQRTLGTCKKNCAEPPKSEIINLASYEQGPGYVLASDGSVPHGAQINKLVCKNGFACIGKETYSCDDGQWWTDETKPSCWRGCSNFPLQPDQGSYVYDDKARGDHREGSKIIDLSCNAGYRSEGFAPLVCQNGQWVGEHLGSCSEESRLSVTLQGPYSQDGSFYIYLLIDGERSAGYLIDGQLYPTYQDKKYPLTFATGNSYRLGVECGVFRASEEKGNSTHRKFYSQFTVSFSPGEHLTVTCGEVSSDRQGDIGLHEQTP